MKRSCVWQGMARTERIQYQWRATCMKGDLDKATASTLLVNFPEALSLQPLSKQVNFCDTFIKDTEK